MNWHGIHVTGFHDEKSAREFASATTARIIVTTVTVLCKKYLHTLKIACYFDWLKSCFEACDWPIGQIKAASVQILFA